MLSTDTEFEFVYRHGPGPSRQEIHIKHVPKPVVFQELQADGGNKNLGGGTFPNPGDVGFPQIKTPLQA